MLLKVRPTSVKTEKVRPLFTPGLIVMLILVSSFLLIRPKIKEIISARKNLKKEEKRLAQITAKVAALEGLDQTELSEKADITAKALPSEKDLPLLLYSLKSLSAKNNIELQSIQVDPGELATVSAEEKKDRLDFLSFKIIVVGQMTNFKEFLTQLVKTAPLMRGESVNLVTEETGEVSQADISLEAPFLLPPVTLGVPETPITQITPGEEKTYQKLARLDFYLVEEELPSVPAGKENPFAF